MKFIVITFLGLSFLQMGCTRPTGDGGKSRVSFHIPQGALSKAGALGVSLPSDKKACYGINVVGENIATNSRSCNLKTGILAGTAEAGSSGVVIELDVPKGPARTFELVIVLVGSSESCPSIAGDFFDNYSHLSSAYVAGQAKDVNLTLDSQAIEITLDFPGVANSLACGGLKASLLSSGDVLDSSGSVLSAYSHPTNESFYFSSFTDSLGVAMITSGGMVNFFASNPIQAPPHVFSFTRKPDTGEIFGLLNDGQIVKVNGGSFSYEVPNPCPFAVSECRVPVWMQSISAGFGDQIFGLDHAGNLYSLPGENVVLTLPLNVTQVSYY